MDRAGFVNAARLWAFRAQAELEAAARFARFEREMVRFAATPAVIDLAGQAALDERRHHVRCAELAHRFGAPEIEADELAAQPLRTGLVDPRQQLLYEVVAMSCITESLSTALLVRMRRDAQDDAVRDVVQEILRDEVQHARLGWAHLAAEAQQGSVAFVGPRLPAMLAATVDDEIFAAHPGLADDLAPLGGLPRAARCQIFESTMREVVFPGLRRFGVETGRAERWLAARRPRA